MPEGATRIAESDEGLFLRPIDCRGGGGAKLFSPDYFSARSAFLDSANRQKVISENHRITALGPKGEALHIDFARLGPENAKRAALIISGTHGVEGFPGSAIQRAILESEPKLPAETALFFVHVLNPYGMSHLRRANESNVDLNRNFVIDETTWKFKSPDYATHNHFLNPPRPPGIVDWFYFEAMIKAIRYGTQEVKQASALGQYEFPRGLFYGGSKKEESTVVLEEWLKATFSKVERLFVLEVHTGLGKFGVSSLLLELDESDSRVPGIRRQFDGFHLETSGHSSVAYSTNGCIADGAPRLLPQTDVVWITQEVGTYPLLVMSKILRDENRAFHYLLDRGRTKHKLRDMFNPPDAGWRDRVVSDGLDLLERGINYING